MFQVSRERWLIAIGDVCGKGVDAAVVTGLARHTIRAVALEGPSPSEVVQRLNHVLVRDARPVEGDLWTPRFCTVALFELTAEAAEVVTCIGGHPLPWIVTADGAREVGAVNTVLGIDDDARFASDTVTLAPGDLLVTFTDGLTERRRGDRFFDDELPAALDAVRSASAEAAAASLEAAVLSFAPGPLADDLAVLVVRRG